MESSNQTAILINIRKLEGILRDGITTKDPIIITFLKRDIYPLYKKEVKKIFQLTENTEIQKHYLE